MKKNLLFFFLFLLSLCSIAQEATENTPTRGTITVQKKGRLHSVLYDDVNFRLVCKDVYGNIIDTAVVAFDLNVTIKGIAYAEKDAGCFISKTMQQRLSRMDGIIVYMFSNIKAKEKDGTVVSLPDFKYQAGFSREQNDY
ncbi:MAG: hypothetical protein JWP12_3285 [Bacteroidetes bacterium]|nr:hypothetical protein [Bacteroidota bacterium]